MITISFNYWEQNPVTLKLTLRNRLEKHIDLDTAIQFALNVKEFTNDQPIYISEDGQTLWRRGDGRTLEEFAKEYGIDMEVPWI